MVKLNSILMLIGIVVVLLIMVTIFPVKNQPGLPNFPNTNEVKKFSSLQELQDFLKAKQDQGYYGGVAKELGIAGAPEAPSATKSAVADSSRDTVDYSTTNIQVQGVDEPDIVKNDDKYIYVVSQDKISIIEAYPAENSKLLYNLDVNGTVNEIFINKNKLTVFGQENYYYPGPIPLESGKAIASPTIVRPIPYYGAKSFIRIYNIENKEAPSLEKEITFEGNYYDARMINNYVYAIVNQPINYIDDKVLLPIIEYDKIASPVVANDVYYFNIPDYGYRLTTIFSIDLNNFDINRENFLTGYTQNIFVSQDNIYLTSQKYATQSEYGKLEEEIIKEALIPLVDASTAGEIRKVLDKDINIYEKQQETQELFANYYNKLNKNEKENLLKKYEEKATEIRTEFQKELEKTIIHKISVNGNEIKYIAKGEVPGVVLNQFSMDEYKNNFRIATTTGDFSGSSLNHMYILDEDMKIIGKLEDLAKNERIYSVRFFNERAYMVTFKRVDPLFVIDLSNPENPKVLGELKIPGYSDYLHPYDEDHVIGIGKDVDENIDADLVHTPGAIYYTAIKGLKMSLFDVSDVENPKEVSKIVIGDRGTDSEVLYEHKAFLFDKEKELIVIPVSVYEDNSKNLNNYPQLAFEGAYVFSLNLENGFNLRGKITHLDSGDIAKSGNYYSNYNLKIRRSLFIDNMLYTISAKEVKINSLANIEEIKVINLPFKREDYPVIY